MLRFENEYMFYGLLLIPFLVVWYIYIRIKQKKTWVSYGENYLLKGLMPDTSPVMKTFKFILLCIAYTSLIFALANPQIGASVEKGKRKGIDIMLCLDVSNSMLAQDLSPNRLESAKSAILSFIDKLKGDRIGLVVFAGKSFVQLPITSDYAAAKTFIYNVSTRSINEQGTDIASALDKAAASMLPYKDNTLAKQSDNPETNKVIVLISDGEDHADDALEMTQTVAKQGIKVFAIGIGSSLGEPIPVHRYGGQTQYKKDKEGNTVITRLNEKILKDIAIAGNGTYIHAVNANVGFDVLAKELGKIEKTELEDVVFSRYHTKYFFPLWIALFLLLLEVILYSKKLLRLSDFSWLNKKVFILICTTCFSVYSLNAQSKETYQYLRQGNTYYSKAEKLDKETEELKKKKGEVYHQNSVAKQQEAQKLYEKASTSYLKSNETNTDYYKSLFNLGSSLYKQGKYEEAAKQFDKVANMNAINKNVKAKAYHNLGNSLLKQQKYEESIQAYKNALKANPSDMDTKYNLEYAKRMLTVQQQQQQNQQQQNQERQQNKDQNIEQEQNQQQQQAKDKDNQQNKDNQKEQQQKQQTQKEAKRQLDALQQNERRTQEKVKEAEMQKTHPVKQEKDW